MKKDKLSASASTTKEQYEVWFQDRRTLEMRVVYTMADSFEEARMNVGGKPVDCRKRVFPKKERTVWWQKKYQMTD